MTEGASLADRVFRHLSRRRAAYRHVFNHPEAETVLADLARFCRAAHAHDPGHLERLEGRREVWLRIQQHLNLTDQQLFELVTTNQGEDER
jgi:hypothetical protein